jgi:hypothetical protein
MLLPTVATWPLLPPSGTARPPDTAGPDSVCAWLAFGGAVPLLNSPPHPSWPHRVSRTAPAAPPSPAVPAACVTGVPPNWCLYTRLCWHCSDDRSLSLPVRHFVSSAHLCTRFCLLCAPVLELVQRTRCSCVMGKNKSIQRSLRHGESAVVLPVGSVWEDEVWAAS